MFLRTFGRVNCRKFSSAPISFQLQFCIDSVKRSDYENFLATLLLPTKDGCRDSVFALRAFNIELAKIPDSSSNPLVAKVKFQFWTETLEKIYTGAKVPAQPVAIALR